MSMLASIRRSRGRVVVGGGGGSPGLQNRWSDSATWGGTPPTNDDDIVIPAGQTFMLDTLSAQAGTLTVAGVLQVDPAVDTALLARRIVVELTGEIMAGTASIPHARSLVITLNGAEAGRATGYRADMTATTGAGNGKLRRLWTSTGAVNETVTVTFSSATAFTVSGSVSGALGSGTVGTPFNNRVRFIATAGTTAWAAGNTVTIRVQSIAFTNSGGPRSLQVMPGGKLNLFGLPKTQTMKINEHLADGATSATLLTAPTGWQVGDEIVIGPTDFDDTTSGIPLKRTLTSASGTAIGWTGGITGSRWGRLQYATDAGMSLTPGTLTKPDDWTQEEWDGTPKVLDQRATIMNVTRNIVIQGADDTAWTGSGFGAHAMFMGLASEVRLDSVEFRRMGQAGALGRYPVHWHMLSYATPDGMALPSDGTFLGAADPAKHFMRRCAVNGSSQRGVVIHGSHGIDIDSNVFFDVKGHCIFLEDGSEENCRITNNVVIKVEMPTAANQLLRSERNAHMGRSSGIWLPNCNNHIEGNEVYAAPTGIWNSIAGTQCFGQSEDVAIVPITRPMLAHKNNTAACCGFRGILTDSPPIDNLGEVIGARFFRTYQSLGGFEFVGNVVWKNRPVGYNNRVLAVQNSTTGVKGEYRGWTAADNEMLDFSGQATPSVPMHRVLTVGVSLNNGNNAEQRATDNRRCSWVSYDEGFVVKNAIGVNFPLREPPAFTRDSFAGQTYGIQGGAYVRGGEYIYPVWTFFEYGKWKLINSATMWWVTPPHADGQPLANGSGYQVGALKNTLGVFRDESGVVTGTVNKNIVFNTPFYTYGAINAQPWEHSAAISTDTQHIGIQATGICTGIAPAGSSPFSPMFPFYVDRQDAAGNVVGSWNVPDARSDGYGLSHFRHFAAARGGIYRLHFDGELPSSVAGAPVAVRLNLSLLESSADAFTLGIAWPNGVPAQTVYMYYAPENASSTPLMSAGDLAASPPRAIKYTSTGMTSRADVIADTTGRKFWQDTTNNVVWIKVVGGQLDENGIHTHNYSETIDRYYGRVLGVRSDNRP